MPKTPVLVLVVLDGWGLSNHKEGNAVAQAQLPTMESLYSRYPWVSLEASGTRVGLPDGQMGNSEVGHLNIGAGRVVDQDITRINRAIGDREFFQNTQIKAILEAARNQKLHLLGLLSDGGVHSHLDHLLSFLQFAKQQGITEVCIHAFTDGRDTSPRGSLHYIRTLQEQIQRLGVGQIASVSGRYYAMDRDNRWQRTEKAYRTIVEGTSDRHFTDPLEGICTSHAEKITDEFVVPFTIVDDAGKPVGVLQEDHAAIFFNFRADRARQLTRSLTFQEFEHFPRSQSGVRHFLTMTEYDRTFALPIAFAPIQLERILVKLLTQKNVRNLRLAETEKYAHVTYFFNGGEEQLFECEERLLIPSPQVPTYDLKPEMSAFGIRDRLIHELEEGNFDAVVMNFANADMVGHTGVMAATVKAVETIDSCLGDIHRKVQEMGGIMIITADHGNAEQMIDPSTGEIHTAHTTNPVPFILVDDHCTTQLRRGGALEDIAPTLLDYLEIEKPPEMSGHSLLLVD